MKRILLLFSISLLATSCGDKPLIHTPCNWARHDPEIVPLPEVTLVCNLQDKPVRGQIYWNPDFDGYRDYETFELNVQLFEDNDSEEFIGSFQIHLPNEPRSGDEQIGYTSPYLLEPVSENATGQVVWEREGDVPFQDIARKELEEGRVYTATLDYTVNLDTTFSSSNCDIGTIKIENLQRTVELSSEIGYCDTYAEDLKDIRIGH